MKIYIFSQIKLTHPLLKPYRTVKILFTVSVSNLFLVFPLMLLKIKKAHSTVAFEKGKHCLDIFGKTQLSPEYFFF